MHERIRCEKLKDKIISAEEAASWVKDGMTIGTSGFTPAGFPKLVPSALADRIATMNEPFGIDLITGASVGEELDGRLAEMNAIRRRIPYQSNRTLRRQINEGQVRFSDMHLSHITPELRYGNLGTVDIGIIEAHAITEAGHIVPTTSVGISPTVARVAKTLIVELNITHPMELEGIHDIFIPADQPDRQPIPLVRPANRIGRPFIIAGPDRIQGIVISDKVDHVPDFHPATETEHTIARHLLDFVCHEIKVGRIPDSLPWQSGVGGVANAVLQGFLDAPLGQLEFFSEVLQDSVLDLIDAGRLAFASGCSVTLSDKGLERFHREIRKYKRHIVLRPQEMSNNPELIRRLGVIAVNTAIECDIYGHVNSTHVLGGQLVNGIGGSGDFARNAWLTVFVTPSTAKNGLISAIVPFCSHVDHAEHSVDVMVTEQGLADLRGKSPRERAQLIIDRCAHPDYRPLLNDYFARACKDRGGHEPHLLDEAFGFHTRFLATGSMK